MGETECFLRLQLYSEAVWDMDKVPYSGKC